MADIILAGSTSGSITVSSPAISGTNTLTLPAVTDTLVGLATTDTLTNKTLTSPVLTTPALGTPASGNLVNCTGTGATLGTLVAVSGTSIDFTGIPAGTKQITVMFISIVMAVDSNFLVQIGDAGGIETSGYDSEAGRNNGAVANSTAGFIASASYGGTPWTTVGAVTLTLANSSTFLWVATGAQGQALGTIHTSGGCKALSQELTQLRITTVSGTNTFNSGSLNIQYRS